VRRELAEELLLACGISFDVGLIPQRITAASGKKER
jgi:hypothetical protein